jgi:hypothetical protein
MLQIPDCILFAGDIMLRKLVNDTVKFQAPLLLFAGGNPFNRLRV